MNNSIDIQGYDDTQRQALLSAYVVKDHLTHWSATDRKTGKVSTVDYLPAGWRLYELGLRYPTANFSSDIFHMDAERDFVIVKVKLYLGMDFENSPKKAEAFKQGKLSQLDKVETGAKARAARDFGISTELALDMDDAPREEVPQSEMLDSIKERCVLLDVNLEDLIAKAKKHAPLHTPLTDEDCIRLNSALDYIESRKSQAA